MENIEKIKSLLNNRSPLPKANPIELAARAQAPALTGNLLLKGAGTAEGGVGHGRPSLRSRLDGGRDDRPVVLQGSSNYQRIRALKDINIQPPVADARRGWNSKSLPAGKAPKERFPRITVDSKSKFDYLFGGRSVSDATMKPHQQYVRGHTLDHKKKNNKSNTVGSEHKKKSLSALKKIDFAAALDQWGNGEGNMTDVVKKAKEVFDALAMGTGQITAEILREHLLLTTPPGVALYEAFDFFSESCNQKEYLDFGDFLRYGEQLRGRIFAYEEFASLTDKNKLVATANRVLLGVSPTSGVEIRRLLFDALKNQEEGRMKGTFRPMRMYEFLFLVKLNENAKRKKLPTHA